MITHVTYSLKKRILPVGIMAGDDINTEQGARDGSATKMLVE